MSDSSELGSYIIKGGEEGRQRLSVLARVMAPATSALLDRFEPLEGAKVVDAGCGPGEVTFELARRVGPKGRVIGIDLDRTKLAAARREAAERNVRNVEFHETSVVHTWPVERADFVHIRFVLTHLPNPEEMLARALEVLAPGGRLAVQDIDLEGQFCHPPCRAFELHLELYTKGARIRGVDPTIGRRLEFLLEAAGFTDVDSTLTQPYGRRGEAKQIPVLTQHAVNDALLASGVASKAELDAVLAELTAFAARPDTVMSMPRVFQAWGRKG